MLARLVGRLVTMAELLAAAAAAAASSQLSAFVRAYMQNLAGRAAEAERDVTGVLDRAADAGMTLGAYLDVFRTAANPIFVREGEALAAKVEHYAVLSSNLAALRQAGIWDLPFVFLARLEREVAADTWAGFAPSLPLDLASLAHAAMAALAALLLCEAAKALIGAPLRLMARSTRTTGKE